MDAFALFDLTEGVLVLCPHCSNVHTHLTDPGRLINVSAPCDETKTYKISKTLTGKQISSGLKAYRYDLEKKRRAYARKKASRTVGNEGFIPDPPHES